MPEQNTRDRKQALLPVTRSLHQKFKAWCEERGWLLYSTADKALLQYMRRVEQREELDKL